MSDANDRADLITQLHYIDTITGGDVAKRAAAALTEAQERWDRHERVNTDLHRVCSEAQQKITEQDAMITTALALARAIMFDCDALEAREQIIAALTHPEGTR